MKKQTQETPSQNPLQEKLHYYFVGEGFLKLMADLEIDPKKLKPGETVTQAQQEKIHAFAQEVLKKIEPEWDWQSGKDILMHFDLPTAPDELKEQILELIKTLEDKNHPLIQARNEVLIRKEDQSIVKDLDQAATKVRHEILKNIREHKNSEKIYGIDTMLGEGGLGKIYDTQGAYSRRLKIGSHEVVAKFSKQNAINPIVQNNPQFMEATQNEPYLMAYYGSLKNQPKPKKDGNPWWTSWNTSMATL